MRKMNSNSNGSKSSFIGECLAGAGLAGAMCLAVAVYQWPSGSVIALVAWAGLFSFGVFCGLILILSIPAVVTHWLEHRAYWRTLAADVPRGTEPTPEPVIIHQPPAPDPHADEWREYWLAALDYAGQVGGVSYRRMADFFGKDNPTWRECFALPMVRAGYIRPIQHGIETTVADGQSVDKVRWALEDRRSTLTHPPFAPPSRFGKQPTQPTVENGAETVVFASEH